MSDRRTDALILGATGQDGHYLTALAARAGLTVVGTSRERHEGLIQLDPLDRTAFTTLLDEYAPVRLFMLSGQSSVGTSWREPEATVRSNVAPLLTSLEWMRDRGAATRLVYAASGECFGPRSADHPAREGDRFAPTSPYGVAKSMAATLLRGYREGYGLHASNAFLFNHESVRRPERFVFGKLRAGIARRLTASDDGTPITLGDLSVVRDWGWAPDYCNAMLKMADRDEPDDLILATGKSVSLAEAVAALLAEAGLPPDTVFSEPTDHGHSVGDAQYADPSRARAAIGWTGSTPFPELASYLLAGTGT